MVDRVPHRSRAREASILEFHNCSIFGIERRLNTTIKCSKRRKQGQYHN